jgi:hypothetical protein
MSTDLDLSDQIQLFNLHHVGITDAEKYSQLIGLYDMCPKGVSKKLKITKTPTIIDREFQYSKDGVKTEVKVNINPALVRQTSYLPNPDYNPEDSTSNKRIVMDKEVFMYPSEFENRLEEALIYIGSQGGAVDKQNGRLGIFFTLSQLRSTMKKLGCACNITKIKEGIDVLRKCTVDITLKSPNSGTLSFTGTRIDGLIIHDRSQWVKHEGTDYANDQRCFCYLHPLAASEVSIGNHTLHDLELYSSISGDLAKALFRRLCAKYTYADPKSEYSVKASDFLRTTDRGFVVSRKSWQDLKTALKQLETLDLISRFEFLPLNDDPKDSRKITDYVLRVWSSKIFRDYMVKSNKLRPNKRDIISTSYKS